MMNFGSLKMLFLVYLDYENLHKVPVGRSRSARNMLYKLILVTASLSRTICIQLYACCIFTDVQQGVQTHPSGGG